LNQYYNSNTKQNQNSSNNFNRNENDIPVDECTNNNETVNTKNEEIEPVFPSILKQREIKKVDLDFVTLIKSKTNLSLNFTLVNLVDNSHHGVTIPVDITKRIDQSLSE